VQSLRLLAGQNDDERQVKILGQVMGLAAIVAVAIAVAMLDEVM